ncbi:hypothetical protein GWI33_022676 [Rhynchophorus ferrugineus]|uniref:Uncharacterized protein n=1 Tax=Rhynchophorus ferrugineus TaxID=354439 RepID=A0A834IN98_RHYFE|nr:hypothetical protein GWI33_022676 [Rhynchophorus ferrugineus]
MTCRVSHYLQPKLNYNYVKPISPKRITSNLGSVEIAPTPDLFRSGPDKSSNLVGTPAAAAWMTVIVEFFIGDIQLRQSDKEIKKKMRKATKEMR